MAQHVCLVRGGRLVSLATKRQVLNCPSCQMSPKVYGYGMSKGSACVCVWVQHKEAVGQCVL